MRKSAPVNGFLRAPRTQRLRPIAYCVALACCELAAAANPSGPQVMQGAVQMQGLGTNNLKITNSPGSIIHWQGFSIGAGAVTQFVQQSASSSVLNRVVGADISQIHGQLLSNGRVFLINPAGILIGAGAVIDTAGFVGSTLKMLDGDFLAGKLKFQGDGAAGSIVNQGWIKAGSGGNIVLVAPNIENSGIIQTDGGQIVLAAGQKMTIGSIDLEGVQFEIQAPGDSVLNVGKLLSEGGAIGVFAGTLKHSGDIRAGALARDEAGRIVLKAKEDVTLTASSTTSANGMAGGSVLVQSESGTTLVSGNVEAKGSAGKGGDVRLLGDRVGVIGNALVDASGETGGGQILVGGDFQGRNANVQNASRALVGSNATLRADAGASGDGGRVIVWANGDTRFDGTINARGAFGGNGGFVETSGKESLIVGDARVDARAPEGGMGTWLLDPKNITVATGGGATLAQSDQFTDTPSTDVTISPATINGAGANVVLQANNDITFANAVTVPTTRSLTAQAGRSIFVNANISGADSPGIMLIANETLAAGVVPAQRDPGAATLTMAPGVTISQTGGGDVVLRMNSGIIGDPTKTAGNIVVGNLVVDAGRVNVVHDGAQAGGNILRAATASSIQAAGSVNLQISNTATPSGTGSIGASGAPINLDTPVFEAHTRTATGGIFLNSTRAAAVQVGGAGLNTSTVKGIQTVAGGPIEVTSAQTLNSQTGTAVCGTAGGTGGPICAGSSAGAASALGGTDTVTLRAPDIELARAVRGRVVSLLPPAGNVIQLNSAAGAGAAFRLSQADITNVDAGLLRIGEVASGAAGFINAGLTVTVPLEISSGGAITGAAAAGTNDLTQTGALTLRGTSIGTAGDDLFITPNSTVSATATTGGIFIRHANAAGMRLSNYTLALPAAQTLRLTNSGGGLAQIFVDADLNVPGANVILSGFATTTQFPFENSPTVNAATLTLNGSSIFNNGAGTATLNTQVTANSSGALASADFNSGTVNFNGTSIFNGNPVTFDGATVNFAQAATFNTGVTINAGTANFNANSAITANDLTLTGGVLSGTQTLTVNGDLNWSGGGMSGTGTTLVTNSTTMNGGAKTFSQRTLQTDDDVTWSAGNVTASNGGTWINNGGVFAITGGVQWASGGGNPTTFDNRAGLTSSAGAGGVAALDHMVFGGTGTDTITVATGTLRLSQGLAANVSSSPSTTNIAAGATLEYAGGNNFVTGAINGDGTVLVSGGFFDPRGVFSPGIFNQTGGNSSFTVVTTVDPTTVNISAGNANFAVPATTTGGSLSGTGELSVANGGNTFTLTGGGTFNWNGGTLIGNGAFVVNGGTTLNIATAAAHTMDGGAKINNLNLGTVNWTGGTIAGGPSGGIGEMNNAGQWNASAAGTVTAPALGSLTFNNQAGGTFTKSGISTTTAFGVAFNNAGLVTINGGTLSLDNGGTSPNNFAVGSGQTLQFGGGIHAVSGAIGGTTPGATGNLTVSAGTLTSTGSISTAGTLTVSGGIANFNANATALTPNAVVLSGAGTANFNRTLTDAGTFAISGTAVADFASAGTVGGAATMSGGTIQGAGGLTINNTLGLTGGNIANAVTVNGTTTVSAGTPQITAAGFLDSNVFNMTGGTLGLAGTLAATGPGASTVSGGILNNTGTLRANNASTLTFNGTAILNNSNVLDAQAGSSIVYGATQNFNAGTSFTGGALANRVTSSSTFTGAITSANLSLEGGNHGGTATLAGTTGWSGGDITGNFTIPALSTFNVTGVAAKDVSGAGALLTNQGTLAISGVMGLANNANAVNDGTATLAGAGAGLVIDAGSTFTNAATRNFNLTPAVTNTGITGGGTFQNNGILNANAAGINTLIGTVYNNAGTTNVDAGTLRLTGGGAGAGAFAADAGTTLEFGGGAHAVGGTIGTAGNLAVTAGMLTANGAVNTTGGLAVSGTGVAEFNAAAVFGGVSTLSGGAIQGTGGVTINNTLGFTGGTIANALTVNGTTTVSGAGAPQITGTLDSDVFNMTGGTLAVTGTVAASGGGASTVSGGVLNNTGTVRATNGSTLTFNSAVTLNNGSVLDAASGSIVYGGGVLNFNAGTNFMGAALANRVTSSSTFTGAITAGNLSLEGGNFGGTATLAGTTGWSGGNITGNFTIPASSTLNATAAGLSQAGTMTLGGTLSLTNNAGVANDGTVNQTGALTIAGGSTFTNAATRNYNLTVATTNTGITGAGTFQNNGVLNSNAAAPTVTLIGTIYNNAGTTNVDAGTLRLTGGGAGAGAFAADAGTTLEFGGGAHAVGGTIGTAGNLAVTAGMLTANGAVNTTGGLAVSGTGVAEFNAAAVFGGASTLSGGAIQGAAPVTLNNGVTISGGTIAGAGGVTVAGTSSVTAGSTLTLPGTLNLGANAALTNNGTVNQTGLLTIANGATFTNAAGRTYNLTAPANNTGITGAGTFQNDGILNSNAAGINTLIGTVYNNAGTTNVDAGTLRLTGGGSHGGTFDVDAGTTLDFGGGNHVLTAGVASGGIIGAGSLLLSGGTLSVNAPGQTKVIGLAFNNAGTFNVDGGTLRLTVGGTHSGTFALDPGTTLEFGGGAHTLSGNIGADGSLAVSAGSLTTTAAINTAGGLMVSGGVAQFNAAATFGGASTLSGSGTIQGAAAIALNNGVTIGSGTITGAGGVTVVGASSVTAGSTLTLPGTLNLGANATLTNNGTVNQTGLLTIANGATLTNAAGRTYNLTAPANNTGITGAGTFQNDGILNSNAAGITTLIGSAYNNAGTTNVDAGTLRLTGGGSHGGTFDVDAGTTLDFGGGAHTLTAGVASGGIIGAGSLALTGGTLSVNAPGQTKVIGLAFNNAGTFNVDGGTLRLTTNGTHSGAFALAAGTTLEFGGGAHTLTSTGSIGPNGSLAVSAGSLTTNAAVNTAGGLLVSGGVAQFDAAGTFGGASTLSGGTIQGGGAVALNNGVTISGGTITGAGGVTVAGTSSVTAGSTLTLPGTLNLGANATLTSNGTVNQTGLLTIANGATFTNAAGRTYNLTAPANNTGITGAGTFQNDGILNSNAAGITTLIGSAYNNAGTTNVDAGTLRLTGGGSHGGTFDVDAGTTLDFGGGAHTLTSGVASGGIIGAGSLALTGGALSVNAPGQTKVIGLAFNNAGTFNVDGGTLRLTASGTHSGTFALDPGTTLEFGGGTHTLSGSIGADGSLAVSAGSLTTTTAINTAGGLMVSGGTAQFNTAATFGGASTLSGGTIQGAGGVTVNGTTSVSGGAAQIATTFDTDALNMTAGTLTLSGTLLVSGNLASTVTGGTLINTGTLSKTGGGSLTFSNAAALTNSSVLNAQAGTIVYGATQNFNNGTSFTGGALANRVTAGNSTFGNVTSANLSLEGGDFGGTATLTGATGWSGGNITGNFTIPAASQLNVTGATAKAVSGAGAVLTNLGTTTIGGPLSIASGANVINDGTMTLAGAGAIAIGAGSTFTNAATRTFALPANSVTGAGTFQNNGIVDSNAPGGTALIGGVYNNAGTTNVDGGMLRLTGGGAHTGTFAVDGGTVLEFGGGTHNFNSGPGITGPGAIVVSGGTVNFNNATGLGNAFTLTGTGTTLGGSGALELNGPLTWSQGAGIAGAGTLVTTGVTTVTGNSNGIAKNWTNAVGGTVNMDPGASLAFTGASTFTNRGTFNLPSTGAVPIADASALGTIVNEGPFNKAGPGTQSVLANVFTNAAGGQLNVSNGTLQIPGLANNAGVITVSNDAVLSTNGLNGINNTGTLRGIGTISVGGQTVFNNGLVSPGLSPGTLTIDGNYVQGPLGQLLIELAGTQQGVTYDLLKVTGNAILDGTLQVLLLNGFRPGPTDRFNFMTFNTRTGDFSTFILPAGSSLTAFGEATTYVLRFPFLLENDALKEAKRLNDRFYSDSEEREAEIELPKIALQCN